MKVKWSNKSVPSHILEKIDNSKEINSDGEIKFESFSLSDNKSALSQLLIFDVEIPEVEKKRIIWEGIINIGKKQTITQERLTKELSKLQRQYLEKTKEKYVLLSSLSLTNSINIPRKNIEGSIFTFSRNIPKAFIKSRIKIYNYAKHSIHGDIPNNYLDVRVSISGRSEYDAIDKSLDKLDLIRGIWNLYFNRIETMRGSSGQKKPVNKILLGPIQTLHYSSGREATSAYWYETSYIKKMNLFNCNNQIENMFMFEASVRKRLKNHKYYNAISSLIIRYCRSLDDSNLSSSFLGLWGTLEALTGSLNASYDVTIRRAAFMWEESEYHSQILQHLRIYRNKNIHAGSASDDIETYVYQLKRYVEQLLEFHIYNKFGFCNIEEASNFMSLSTDTLVLNKKKKLVVSALKFRDS